VLIRPKNAAVKINGENATTTSDGELRLEGHLGKTFEVQVKVGAKVKTKTISITDVGASPPMIDLNETEAPSSTKTKRPSDTATQL
jgi:hypothetical protein